jgi:hypothetical protein
LLQVVPHLGYSVHGASHLLLLTALTGLAAATYLQCVYCDPGKLSSYKQTFVCSYSVSAETACDTDCHALGGALLPFPAQLGFVGTRTVLNIQANCL